MDAIVTTAYYHLFCDCICYVTHDELLFVFDVVPLTFAAFSTLYMNVIDVHSIAFFFIFYMDDVFIYISKN